MAERAPAGGVRLRHRQRGARRDAGPRRARNPGETRARSRRRASRSAPAERSNGRTAPPPARPPAWRERWLCPTATRRRSDSSRARSSPASRARSSAASRSSSTTASRGAEYYHPQRNRGTLMCHYRHRAHGDPFFLPGLQDITAHVDFTAIAEAARAAGPGRARLRDTGAAARELRVDRGDVAGSSRGRANGICRSPPPPTSSPARRRWASSSGDRVRARRRGRSRGIPVGRPAAPLSPPPPPPPPPPPGATGSRRRGC